MWNVPVTYGDNSGAADTIQGLQSRYRGNDSSKWTDSEANSTFRSGSTASYHERRSSQCCSRSRNFTERRPVFERGGRFYGEFDFSF